MKQKGSQTYPPGLYVVATPIGNLRDMTLRALDILEQADLILCEDTRVTATLLSHYGIKKPLLSYHDHNGEYRRPAVLGALAEQKKVALVSDAGTPLISDPGYKLVREAVKQGFHVTAIPGASSLTMALCLSGLPTDRFFFAGFLPAKKEACKKMLKLLSAIPATLVVFESAKRLASTLALLKQELGDRQAAVARELTKMYEETRRGPLSELEDYYMRREPKGEVVMVIAPPPENQAMEENEIQNGLAQLLVSNSVKEAASIIAEMTGRPRKEMYALALKLSKHE